VNRAAITLRRLTAADAEGWAAMRQAMFPEEPPQELADEIPGMLADEKQAAFVATSGGRFVGFIEAGERSVAEGAATRPVAYVEALWVEEASRRQGVARRLVDTVKDWARGRGYRELASDTHVENFDSQAMHGRLGFTETDRIVTYLMRL
jgi:aminoglycoside 6'-N-acetyltransferase I